MQAWYRAVVTWAGLSHSHNGTIQNWWKLYGEDFEVKDSKKLRVPTVLMFSTEKLIRNSFSEESNQLSGRAGDGKIVILMKPGNPREVLH